MELWFTEYQTPNLAMKTRVDETLYMGRSEYQDVAVVDSLQFGRMLVLDGVFQTCLFDEFVYHEMITHVPLLTHPDPRRILVIGGGDGGTVREAVKHPTVEKVEMVEIDGLVVDVCKAYLPEISEALICEHPKLDLKIDDGIKHVKEAENQYDVIIVDCSDPIGPGEGLFTHAFYRDVHRALKADGLFVQQTESPWLHQDLIRRLTKDVRSLFPICRMYTAHIPLYPSGMHCFTMGSKCHDPLKQELSRTYDFHTRYFNPDIFKSAFALPNFVREMLK